MLKLFHNFIESGFATKLSARRREKKSQMIKKKRFKKLCQTEAHPPLLLLLGKSLFKTNKHLKTLPFKLSEKLIWTETSAPHIFFFSFFDMNKHFWNFIVKKSVDFMQVSLCNYTDVYLYVHCSKKVSNHLYLSLSVFVKWSILKSPKL